MDGVWDLEIHMKGSHLPHAELQGPPVFVSSTCVPHTQPRTWSTAGMPGRLRHERTALTSDPKDLHRF